MLDIRERRQCRVRLARSGFRIHGDIQALEEDIYRHTVGCSRELLVGNQSSATVTILKRDLQTGILTASGTSYDLDSPMCVVCS